MDFLPEFLDQNPVAGSDGVQQVSRSVVEAEMDLVLLYFGASWSLPFRSSLRTMRSFRADLTAKSLDVEVVFICLDEVESDFLAMKQLAPGLSTSFDPEHTKQIVEHFGVSYIPQVVAINPRSGAILESDCLPRLYASGCQFVDSLLKS